VTNLLGIHAQTELGKMQALEAGKKIRKLIESEGKPFKIFCIHSPYKRTIQTSDKVRKAFSDAEILGVQEEVQLREQDFGGSFQDVEKKRMEQAERLRYGRFFYRFPSGESGADVYDRITILENHLLRDIDAGRFPEDTILVLVTHGLAMRIFLMRWFHWTVDQFLKVSNPNNAEPIVLECFAEKHENVAEETKALYRLSERSHAVMEGLEHDMGHSHRYHAFKSTKWVFDNVGGMSIARPTLRVPSDLVPSPTAAHAPSPVGTAYGIGSLVPRSHRGSISHLQSLAEEQPMDAPLDIPDGDSRASEPNEQCGTEPPTAGGTALQRMEQSRFPDRDATRESTAALLAGAGAAHEAEAATAEVAAADAARVPRDGFPQPYITREANAAALAGAGAAHEAATAQATTTHTAAAGHTGDLDACSPTGFHSGHGLRQRVADKLARISIKAGENGDRTAGETTDNPALRGSPGDAWGRLMNDGWGSSVADGDGSIQGLRSTYAF